MRPPPPHQIIICEDLMVEILSWLPVKSLMRLICVSKSLKSLIFDPSFVKLHLQRSPKNAKLLLRLNSFDFDVCCSLSLLSLLNNPSFTIAEDLGFDCGFKDYKVVGSCNGLVCLVAEFCGHSSYGKYHPYDEYQVCLWNPATKLISQEPPALLVAHSNQHRISPRTTFGFGYDSSSDTYKVVAIATIRSQPRYTEVKVYNKGDNCWRNIQSFPGGVRNIKSYVDGVYLSGTLSWLAVPNSNHDWDFPADLSIVSLDLGKETYRQLLLPCGSDDAHHAGEVPRTRPGLGVLKDCLCFSHDFKATHFVVWQMKEYGVENSWIQLLKVRYEDLQIDLTRSYILTPLCTFENGVILALYAGGWRAVLYTQTDHKVEHTKISKNISWIYAYDYVQSLVSPS